MLVGIKLYHRYTSRGTYWFWYYHDFIYLLEGFWNLFSVHKARYFHLTSPAQTKTKKDKKQKTCFTIRFESWAEKRKKWVTAVNIHQTRSKLNIFIWNVLAHHTIRRNICSSKLDLAKTQIVKTHLVWIKTCDKIHVLLSEEE